MPRVEQSQLVRNLSPLLKDLREATEPLIVTRYGKPTAVLMSTEMYRQMREATRKDKPVSADEILRRVQEQA